MHGLLSFFHLAVQHTDVTVDDADVLRCRMGMFLRPLANLDSFNEQAQEFRSQFINGFEPLCLLNEGIHIRR